MYLEHGLQRMVKEFMPEIMVKELSDFGYPNKVRRIYF